MRCNTEEIAVRAEPGSGTYLVPAFVGLAPLVGQRSARRHPGYHARHLNCGHRARRPGQYRLSGLGRVRCGRRARRGHPIAEVRADGGAAANNYLMQFQANILARPMRRPAMLEATALGAAMLAGLACGLWHSPADLARLRGPARIFRPRMAPAERDELLQGWHDAIGRVLSRSGTSGRRRSRPDS